ncbi:MAG: hypothetical protein WCW67_00015 [Candidatus Margulisiibacteriota bacterium]|jgi:hypothetical protein
MRLLLLLLCVVMAGSGAAGGPRFFGGFDLGAGLLNYQEHVPDFNNPSTGTTGRIDSDASPLTYALRGRIEMYWNNSIVGFRSLFPVYASVVTERWAFNGALFQTNDLSYIFSVFDFYGGYSFSPRLEILSGLSLSKAEQTRENFYVNGVRQSTGRSVETIISQNFFVEVRGNQGSRPVWFGYSAGALYPVNVATTNTSLPAFNFTSPGYSFYGKGSFYYSLADEWLCEASLGYRFLHYDGSPWITSGTDTAKWPTNDTSELTATLGWVYSY